MIFVDTNVFIYAAGRQHPLQESARELLFNARRDRLPLCISAEVLQELLHCLMPSRIEGFMDSAMALARDSSELIFDVQADDVWLARSLVTKHPGLAARDLLHLACCLRRKVTDLKTFDRALAAAWAGK